jgi:hypothetical protein
VLSLRSWGAGDLLGGLAAWSDTHLTYMIDIALTTEFAITGGGV